MLGQIPETVLSWFGVYVTLDTQTIMVAGLALPYDVARTIAYGVFAVAFVISEFVLFRWRDEMRSGIARLDRRRAELDEEEEH